MTLSGQVMWALADEGFSASIIINGTNGMFVCMYVCMYLVCWWPGEVDGSDMHICLEISGSRCMHYSMRCRWFWKPVPYIDRSVYITHNHFSCRWWMKYRILVRWSLGNAASVRPSVRGSEFHDDLLWHFPNELLQLLLGLGLGLGLKTRGRFDSIVWMLPSQELTRTVTMKRR